MKPETAGYFIITMIEVKKVLRYNLLMIIIILFIDLLDDFLDTPRLFTIQAQIEISERIRRPDFFF